MSGRITEKRLKEFDAGILLAEAFLEANPGLAQMGEMYINDFKELMGYLHAERQHTTDLENAIYWIKEKDND